MARPLRGVILLAFALVLIAPPADAQGQIAVIVNSSAPVEDISMDGLRRWFLGQVTALADGTRIQLVQNRDVEDDFYQLLLGWSERRFTQHWIGIVFSGAEGTRPREFEQRNLLRYVAETHHAISFIPIQEVDESVRVLRIDGLLPRHPDYPLR